MAYGRFLLVPALASALVAIASCASSYGASAEGSDASGAGGEGGGEDGGQDSSAKGDGEAGPFCRRQPASLFLCDDFDEGPLGFQWTENAENDGVIELREDGALSAPRALLARSTKLPIPQGWAFLRKELGTTPNRIVLRFGVRIDGRGTVYAMLGSVSIRSSTGEYAISLRAAPSGSMSVVEELGDSFREHSFTKTPLPGEWARITMDVTFASPASVRVLVEGVPAPTVDAPLELAIPAGTRNAALGLTYFNTDGWQVRYDDVTIELP